jgi:hypothetical protein
MQKSSQKSKKTKKPKLLENKPYELLELFVALDKIRVKGSGDLNFVSALYCLAMEIKKIDRHLADIMEMYRQLRAKPRSWAEYQADPWTQDDNQRCHP